MLQSHKSCVMGEKKLMQQADKQKFVELQYLALKKYLLSRTKFLFPEFCCFQIESMTTLKKLVVKMLHWATSLSFTQTSLIHLKFITIKSTDNHKSVNQSVSGMERWFTKDQAVLLCWMFTFYIALQWNKKAWKVAKAGIFRAVRIQDRDEKILTTGKFN